MAFYPVLRKPLRGITKISEKLAAQEMKFD